MNDKIKDAYKQSKSIYNDVLTQSKWWSKLDKLKAYTETARILKPGGLFFGCFYIQGERKRSDWIVNCILSKKGWFNPPFQTKSEVQTILRKYYSSIELNNDKAMIWFRCMK